VKIRIKRGQKCFQNPKKDKKNVQFSKPPRFYEKGVKIPPFLASWSKKVFKIVKNCYANFYIFIVEKGLGVFSVLKIRTNE